MTNQNGLTLVELLAAITISTIVLLTTFTLINQSQAEHFTQLENSKELSKNTLILKQLSTDIRGSIQIVENMNEITLHKPASVITTYRYDPTQNTLYRNGQILGRDFKSFDIELVGNSLKIQIKNLRDELLTTTIYIRGD